MKTASSVVLIVWHLLTIQAAAVTSTLESFPDSINGQLLGCVGDRISLTCTRDFEIVNGMTYWTINSSTIPCESLINHLSPDSIPQDCDPFMFQNITVIGQATVTTLSSSAVATANASMSGAVIQCSTSNVPQLSTPIGSGITLCIPDQLAPPDNVEVELMVNGTVQIVWDRPPHVCSARNISYDVNLIPTDGDIIDEGTELPITTSERSVIFYLTPGREYSALLTANNVDCSIFSDIVTKNFTAMQNAATTEAPITLATTEKAATQTDEPSTDLSRSTIVIIIVVVVILVIILIVIAVVICFFFWRPKVLLKHTNTTDATMELHVNEKEKLEADGNHELSPARDEYAVVDKSSKRKPITAAENQALYQDPNCIQHETAPTGDVYAVTEKKQKKKGPTETELAQMYSVPDKTRGGGLNYASLDMPAGGEAKRSAPTEYATVIN